MIRYQALLSANRLLTAANQAIPMVPSTSSKYRALENWKEAFIPNPNIEFRFETANSTILSDDSGLLFRLTTAGVFSYESGSVSSQDVAFASVPPAPRVQRVISGSGRIFCAIKIRADDGSLDCWGNFNGTDMSPVQDLSQLSTIVFTTVTTGTITQAPLLPECIDGYSFACALSTTGAVSCFVSWYRFFLLSIVIDTNCSPPKQNLVHKVTCGNSGFPLGATPSSTFTALTSKDAVVCGLRESGSVECWG